MININIFWGFVVVLSGLNLCFSQAKKSHHHKSVEITQGDKYFDNGDYFLAQEYYLEAIKTFHKDPYVHYKLAESQRLFFDYAKSEENYAIVVDHIEKTFHKHHHHNDYPLARYWYAMMLKNNAKYEQSKEMFEIFMLSFKPEKPVDELYKEKALFEFNGCVYALNELKKPVRDYKFENLPSPVNSANSDYSPGIYKHDSSIVITSAREGTLGSSTFNKLGENFSDNFLFEKKGEKWQVTDQQSGFNSLNTTLNDGAGCFSSDKQKFYFTKCDVSGSGSDGECAIYVSKMNKNKWGAAQKLNENINFSGYWNAQPSLSSTGDTLFFVSKRPGGIGLHDIWMSTKSGDNENWGKALNLRDINTPFSDISPFWHHKEKVLFFASNGHEGFGGLDIYRSEKGELSSAVNLGIPFNSNMDDFYFTLGDSVGYLASNRPGGKGNDDIYKFHIRSFEALIAYIPKDSLGDAKSFTVNGTLLYDDTKSPAKDQVIILKDEFGKEVARTRTNSSGNFRFESVAGGKGYKVILEEDDPRLTAEINFIVEEISTKKFDKPAQRGAFENVYFDYDSYALRPESRLVLNELIELAKKFPNIQIEMNANTDNFGSSDYNKKLSEQRGNAVLKYLSEKGLDNASIIQARGSDYPLASNENPMGRQLNRRVEFTIVGQEYVHVPKYVVFITDNKPDINQIAKKFGMTVDELKKVNGLKSNKLQPFRPVRVKGDGKNVVSQETVSLIESGVYNSMNKDFDIQLISKLENVGPITETDTETLYTVMPKNTVYSIAKHFGLSADELMDLNGMSTPDIKIGQRLIVKKK
ncbi:MAG: LysM peptidoglycan-binding domain-containing protein [Cytophagales bacterium]